MNTKFILRLFIIHCSFLIVLSSCKYFSNRDSETIVARAYDEELTAADLIGIVPKGSSKADSISVIKDFIDNWIRQKVVLHKAENNLNNKQKDFNKQMSNYRNSLVIYTFEKELVRQKLDTTVTEKQIEDYYNNNPADFELKDNIVKVLYVKTISKDPVNKKIKYLYKSEKEKDLDELAELCLRNAVNSFLESDQWLLFNDLIKEIPIQTYDQESYIKNHRFIEFQDSLYSYYVNIKGFRIKEGLSPLSLEKENIRNIIINKRKIQMIKDMEDNAYRDAIKNKDFKVFNNKVKE